MNYVQYLFAFISSLNLLTVLKKKSHTDVALLLAPGPVKWIATFILGILLTLQAQTSFDCV